MLQVTIRTNDGGGVHTHRWQDVTDMYVSTTDTGEVTVAMATSKERQIVCNIPSGNRIELEALK